MVAQKLGYCFALALYRFNGAKLTFPKEFRGPVDFGRKAFMNRTIERGLFQDGAVR